MILRGFFSRIRDRALHPMRSRQARNRLQGLRVRNILVLCHGNVCRSPFLQVSLAKHLADRGRTDITIRSAGFVGPDRSSPPLAVSVAREMGFALEAHRSEVLTAGALQWCDLIVVMSEDQANDVRWRGAPRHVPVILLGDLDRVRTDERAILDPWNRDEAVFRASYGRIDRCAEELAKILASNRL